MDTIREKSVQHTIKKFLQHKLSSIGHSQGAVYSYLYGKQGNEIIVFNPSPIYSEIVPKNSLVIRHPDDIVSWLSPYKNKHELENKNDAHKKDGILISSHQLHHLKNDFTIYGNKKIYTRETHYSNKQKNIKIPQNKTKKRKRGSQKFIHSSRIWENCGVIFR